MTRFRSEVIEAALAVDLVATAERLGSSLRRMSVSERVGPCLVCGGRDRFAINTRKNLWHSRGCGKGGSALDLVQHVHGCNFRTAVDFLTRNGSTPAPQARPRTTPAQLEDNTFVEQLIAGIVGELVPVRRTPGEQYFAEVRKIDTDIIADILERMDAIGWHPSVLFREQGHPLDGKSVGCIIALMTDPVTAKPTGAISRTYLTPDLAKIGKAKTLGKPAGIVRLSEDADVLEGLFLAEGLETALAAMSIGLRPIWAAGSTALIAKFPVLSSIDALTIIADHDANSAGETAAREAEARWRAAGREVRLLRSDAPGDVNDVLREAAK
jgi:Toprim domain